MANQQLANIRPHRFGPLGGAEWSRERFSREVEESTTRSRNTAAAARGRKSESMRVSALAPNDQAPAPVTSLLEILTPSSNEQLNLHVGARRFVQFQTCSMCTCVPSAAFTGTVSPFTGPQNA